MAVSRRLILGVIGGDGNMEAGEELGREATRRGWILLTGGELRPRPEVLATGGEVKDAAMLGAAAVESGRFTPRLIGILPDRAPPKTPRWRRPTQHRLFLDTGLAHNVRNVVNGRTPDVLVAFGGSRGTLAEIAFAIEAGRQVFVHRGFSRLANNFRKYFGPNADASNLEIYFNIPVLLYAGVIGSTESLLFCLRQMFTAKVPLEGDAVHLADRIAKTTCISDSTGFPGLPHEPSALQRFEQIIQEISR